MKEVENTTAVTIVKAICDCGGEFKRMVDDTVLLSHPPVYQYVCEECGKTEQSKTLYPYTIVENIDRSNERKKKRWFDIFRRNL